MRDPFGLIGSTIAHAIRVDDVIAEGGFGIVYRGFHQHFRSPVALKCLKVPETSSPTSRKRVFEQFRREAEVQFRLSGMTSHVVRPLYFGEVRCAARFPVPVMALEWLEGSTLSQYIAQRQQGALPPATLSDILDLLGPAARAVHLGHNFEASDGSFTVVHRDLKPDNIFLSCMGGEQVVKVLDFGISKVERFAPLLAGEQTQAQQAPFSPHYGAPEQWTPTELGQTGPWTDVWGLALTLVETLKGARVLAGGLQAIMFACLNLSKRPTPRNHGVVVPDTVETVFEKALAVDPRERYGSVLEFWQDLRRALTKENESPPDTFRARGEGNFPLPRLRTPRITMPTRPAARRPTRPSINPPSRIEPSCPSSGRCPSSWRHTTHYAAPKSLSPRTDRAVFSWPPSERP